MGNTICIDTDRKENNKEGKHAMKNLHRDRGKDEQDEADEKMDLFSIPCFNETPSGIMDDDAELSVQIERRNIQRESYSNKKHSQPK